MKKAFQICFITAFFLILVIPVLFINIKTQQKSEIDNRYLQEFPSPRSADFSTRFEKYLTDRIGGRDELINFYTNANDTLFGIMSHPSYQFGKDGYVFQRLDQQPSREYIDKFNNLLGKMNKYCEERGTQFIFMLNPSKASVYSEYTPSGMHLDYEWSQWIIDYLEDNGIDYYYSKDDLIAAREEFPTFNKKFDASHWNNDGALFASINLIEHMRQRNANIVPISSDDFKRSVTVEKTLPNSSYVINEEYATYEIIDMATGLVTSPYSYEKTSYRDCLTYDSSHSYLKYFENTAAPDAPTMMIFKGSYFDSFRFQFLLPSFSDSYWVQNYYNVQRFDYFYNVFKPDIVIFEAAEYVIFPAYFPESDLDSVITNPLLSTYDSTAVENFATVDPVDFESISQLAENTEDAAVTISYTVSGEACKYAYLTVNGEIFDFEISTDENGIQTLSVTFKTEKAVQANSSVITLISEDEQKKCVIEQ